MSENENVCVLMLFSLRYHRNVFNYMYMFSITHICVQLHVYVFNYTYMCSVTCICFQLHIYVFSYMYMFSITHICVQWCVYVFNYTYVFSYVYMCFLHFNIKSCFALSTFIQVIFHHTLCSEILCFWLLSLPTIMCSTNCVHNFEDLVFLHFDYIYSPDSVTRTKNLK